MSMVDIHSHILPGLDDGAQDEAEALEMIRIAAADGIDVIAATPHAQQASPCQVADGVRRLNELARQEGLDITIVPGSEVRMEANLPEQYEAGQLVTLNHTPYLLLELWLLGEWPPYLKQAIYDCRRAGLLPILAHAERYPAVQHSPLIVEDLVDAGVLIQVNADSFFRPGGSTTRKTVEVLLRRGLVHVIASDAHHSTVRPPRIREAMDYARSIVGPGYGQWIEETAANIIDGVLVEPPELHLAGHQSRFVRAWERITGR